jgi:F-type H+-transporting ATPase subunit delta
MFLSRLARSFSAVTAKTDHLVVRMFSPTLRILDGAEDVEQILYDSLDGGKSIINANFMIVQSTLKPGLIEIIQKGGTSTKYLISGGVIQKNPNNSVDIALYEAYGKDDIDWEAMKKSDSFAQEPIGDVSHEAEFLRKIGSAVRDHVGTASGSI